MKQYQSIVRILVALVIMFGVQTTANAQFGGLKKLAKKAIEKTTTTTSEKPRRIEVECQMHYREIN